MRRSDRRAATAAVLTIAALVVGLVASAFIADDSSDILGYAYAGEYAATSILVGLGLASVVGSLALGVAAPRPRRSHNARTAKQQGYTTATQGSSLAQVAGYRWRTSPFQVALPPPVQMQPDPGQ